MNENAKWIWRKSQFEKNEYVDFKKSFNLDEADSSAKLYISVDSEYALWINGSFVSCGAYDDYPEYKYYDALEVGQYLKKGMNTIFVSAYYQGESTLQYAIGERGLWFCLENFDLKIVSDEDVLCRLSSTYKSGDMFKVTWQLGYSFIYDAKGEENLSDWEKVEVKNMGAPKEVRPIKKLEIKEPKESIITAQGIFKREEKEGTIADIMYHDYLSHRVFSEIFDGNQSFPIKAKEVYNDGIYLIVDLQKETAGYFTMSLNASEGTTVDIAYGEHLKDLRVRSKIEIRNFAAQYICKEGEQSFTAWFKRMGARYLELHISNYKHLTINNVGIKSADYPVDVCVDYSRENDHRIKLFDTCIETLRLCMHEHYEDCPWREQSLYSFDSRNQMLFGYLVFGEYEFARASLDLLGQRMDDKCQLNLCAPTDEKIQIPSFTLWWLLEMKEYAEKCGDLSLIEKYWNKLVKIIEAAEKRMKKGIAQPPVGTHYFEHYEWSPIYDGEDKAHVELYKNEDFYDGVYHVVFLIALKSLVWIAKKLNKSDEENRFAELFNKAAHDYNNMFWDNDVGAFASYIKDGKRYHYGEYVQSIAFYTGICSKEQEAILFEKLLWGSDLQEVTISYSIFKYEALVNYKPECASEIYKKIEKEWSKMLYAGATSFWETLVGEADFNGAGSLCHGWSALPIYFYFKYVK